MKRGCNSVLEKMYLIDVDLTVYSSHSYSRITSNTTSVILLIPLLLLLSADYNIKREKSLFGLATNG